MQYDDKTIEALANARRSMKAIEIITSLPTKQQLFEIAQLVRSFAALDKAGVFAAIDEQSEMSEAERRMRAIRQERAARCTCSARRAGMQDTDIHVLGCPAIAAPSPRGSARMDCPPVGEPLYGDAGREVAARLREKIGAEEFDALFPNNVHAEKSVMKVQDDEDLTVSGRIIDVLRDAREIYGTPGKERSEGWWDGAVDYVLTGEGRDENAAKSNQCLTCGATDFVDTEALQFHIDAVH